MIILSRRHLSLGFVAFLVALAALLVLWPARPLDSENFVFYLPNQRRLIPLWKAGNTPYLPILPVLELTGQLGMVLQKRSSVEIYIGSIPLKLSRNETKVQVGSLAITLQEPILRANGQWLAPIDFLSSVLPSLIGQQIVYRPGTDRAFLGGVQPISFVVRLQNLPSGVRLIVTFTGAVSIQTAATNGQWIVFLGGAPIQPLEQDFFFQNSYLTKLRFDDQDGRPKLILTPSATGLDFYPRLTGGGETLITDVVHLGGPLPATPPPPGLPGAPAKAPGGPPTPPTPQAPPPLPAVVLDAGHGGADSGARSQDGILEENLTAQVAGATSLALNATKRYRVVFTRPGDSDPSFSQRTVIANTAQPAAFVSFHAGELGDRNPAIAVYTYQPPSPPPAGDSGSQASLFVLWDLAQTAQQARSRVLAQVLQKQFAAIQGIAPVQVLQAPVRQLRSIDAPAVAIELGTLAPAENAGSLTQPNFQKQIANAVVAALEEFSASAGKP